MEIRIPEEFVSQEAEGWCRVGWKTWALGEAVLAWVHTCLPWPHLITESKFPNPATPEKQAPQGGCLALTGALSPEEGRTAI